MRARGQDLSNQLNSATGRRREVQQLLRRATGADRAGLEQRLGVLDARIARLEGDIDENGKQLTSLQVERLSSTQPPFGGFNPNSAGRVVNSVPIAIVFTIFVLSPIALSVSRMFWKRASVPRQLPPSADNSQRLERMEQAIDAISIEIERVSEGQRFVTRLLSEGRANAALGLGAAQPLGVPAEKIIVPR